MTSSSVSKSSIGAYLLKEGNTNDSGILLAIRSECRSLCGWDRETFPGSQPVSLTRRNLETLKQKPYVVCEKSDGERHMLLIYRESVYLIDRMFHVYRVNNIVFPDMKSTTLLDGELIVDTPGDEGSKKIVRYLVYDAVCVKGKDVAKETLLFRLRVAFLELIRPRTPSPGEPFSIYVKDFFDVQHSAKIVFPYGLRLPHECDGLIFTPADDAYKPGTCQRLLKWKPAHLNTVDFVIELVMGFEQHQIHGKLLPAVAGVQKFTGIWLARTGPMWSWLVENRSKLNGKVVECGWDPNAFTFVPSSTKDYVETGNWVQEGGWVLHRVRDDRTTPNDESVVEKVKASIADGISIEDLNAALEDVPKLRLQPRGTKRPLEEGSKK
jgi:mRNA guanylyltransferase